jgi:fructose-1,6-bisphosphatase/inositol monophosphatase family enzyme
MTAVTVVVDMGGGVFNPELGRNPRLSAVGRGEGLPTVDHPDLAFVIDLARRAGALALVHQGHVERQVKRGSEAVTAADRACQALIIDGLKSRFPDDGIIGEENDDGSAITNQAARHGQRVWVIDPIDGTNNYVTGLEHCAVCIGLLDRGQPVLGVVHDLFPGKTYAAAQGHGAWILGRGNEPARQIQANPAPLGPSSIIMMTANLLIDGRLAPWATWLFTQTDWKIRMLGASALETVQVAAGTAHIAVTLNGKLWDVAAPAAILLEAGGLLTTADGRDVFPFDLTGYTGGKVPFIAAAPAASATFLAALRA